MKRFMLVFLLSTGMMGLAMNCCGDVQPYWNMDDCTISVMDKNNQLPINGTLTTDSLVLKMELDVSYLSLNQNPFISSAFALSCEPDGAQGMKDNITNITVSSDTDFNTFPAGSSLNSIASVGTIPLNDWINSIANSTVVDSYYFQGQLITLTEKPTNNTLHKFAITFHFSSGKTEKYSASAVDWL